MFTHTYSHSRSDSNFAVYRRVNGIQLTSDWNFTSGVLCSGPSGQVSALGYSELKKWGLPVT